eukprot:87385-Prorocentrum_lima.AAC.1
MCPAQGSQGGLKGHDKQSRRRILDSGQGSTKGLDSISGRETPCGFKCQKRAPGKFRTGKTQRIWIA